MVGFSVFRMIAVLAAIASSGLASTIHAIRKDVYDDLVFYFKYSSSAYSFICPRPNGHHLVESFWKFKNLLTATQGFVARDEDRREIVLAMRGSFSVMDIITDTGIILTPFDSPGVDAPAGAMVHSGFLAGWNSVANEVLATIRLQLRKYPGYDLVAAGHSLGGAIASLAAGSFKANFPFANVTLYTYGQPRTGNSIYANWLNSELGTHAFRVVHTYDGIPNLIPSEEIPILLEQNSIIKQLEAYRHHGVEYWQTPDPASENTTRRCAAHGEDPECSKSIPSTGLNVAHWTYFGIIAVTPFCIG